MRGILFAFALMLIGTPTLAQSKLSSVVLAGGCFWCVEADFEKLEGIVDAVSGYSGGSLKNPTYKQVSSGTSGHIEVVRITYDTSVLNYEQVLDFFLHHIDPTRDDGQFCDKGSQYRPAIFYQGEAEYRQARDLLKRLEKTKPFAQPIKVELIPAATFYPAEDYHQDYYEKNPIRYNFYRYGCGRDARVKELWGEN